MNKEIFKLYAKMISELSLAKSAEEQSKIMEKYMQLSFECGRRSVVEQ